MSSLQKAAMRQRKVIDEFLEDYDILKPDSPFLEGMEPFIRPVGKRNYAMREYLCNTLRDLLGAYGSPPRKHALVEVKKGFVEIWAAPPTPLPDWVTASATTPGSTSSRSAKRTKADGKKTNLSCPGNDSRDGNDHKHNADTQLLTKTTKPMPTTTTKTPEATATAKKQNRKDSIHRLCDSDSYIETIQDCLDPVVAKRMPPQHFANIMALLADMLLTHSHGLSESFDNNNGLVVDIKAEFNTEKDKISIKYKPVGDFKDSATANVDDPNQENFDFTEKPKAEQGEPKSEDPKQLPPPSESPKELPAPDDVIDV